MVLIFSNSGDLSTDEVQYWLMHYKVDNIRLNENDKIVGLMLSKEKNILKYNSRNLDFDKIQSVFFRRPGGLIFNLPQTSTSFNIAYSKYLKDLEYKTIFDFFEYNLKKKKQINSLGDVENKKLEYLIKASELDINVPEWVVTDNWIEIEKFIVKNKIIVTKPLSMPYFNFIEGSNLLEISYSTKIIKNLDLPNLKRRVQKIELLPSFFQLYIQKRYEIRVFYFNNKFYSMAIFSQQSNNTKFDYRNYDRKNPNSLTPFKIPQDLERKLKILIEFFNYTSCSIDLIYSRNGKFYFLEINPIGQFKWLNDSCNYYIDKHLAKYLAIENKNE